MGLKEAESRSSVRTDTIVPREPGRQTSTRVHPAHTLLRGRRASRQPRNAILARLENTAQADLTTRLALVTKATGARQAPRLRTTTTSLRRAWSYALPASTVRKVRRYRRPAPPIVELSHPRAQPLRRTAKSAQPVPSVPLERRSRSHALGATTAQREHRNRSRVRSVLSIRRKAPKQRQLAWTARLVTIATTEAFRTIQTMFARRAITARWERRENTTARPARSGINPRVDRKTTAILVRPDMSAGLKGSLFQSFAPTAPTVRKARADLPSAKKELTAQPSPRAALHAHKVTSAREPLNTTQNASMELIAPQARPSHCRALQVRLAQALKTTS